jgi:hypothetical protein
MAKLILPPSCKEITEQKSSFKKKIIRTGLNVPLSAMKKIRVPESERDTYTRLAQNEDWYQKHMVAIIEFIDNVTFAKLQLKRIQPDLHKLGITIQEDIDNIN